MSNKSWGVAFSSLLLSTLDVLLSPQSFVISSGTFYYTARGNARETVEIVGCPYKRLRVAKHTTRSEHEQRLRGSSVGDGMLALSP